MKYLILLIQDTRRFCVWFYKLELKNKILVSILFMCLWCIVKYETTDTPLAVSPVAEAAEVKKPLTFAKRLGTYNIFLPLFSGHKYWQIPNAPKYKNDTLRACQDSLRSKGITDLNALRYGCSIIAHENGEMTTDRIHAGGGAYGLCGHNVGNVKAFWKKHPESKTFEYQIEYCTKRFADAYYKYNKDIKPSIVQHHCPACAKARVDSCYDHGHRLNKCYFERVTATTRTLELMY